MSKIIKREINKVETFTVYYNNYIYCDVKLINDILDSYTFYSKSKSFKSPNSKGNTKTNLVYIENDINDILKEHWSKHYEILSIVKINNIDDIINFKDFEKLYYIGSHVDGKVKTYDGKILSSLMTVDSITNKIYSKIKTLKKCEKIKDTFLNCKSVSNFQIVDIPYYNRDKDNHTHTIKYDILLSQEIFDNIIKKYDKDYFDSELKSVITKMIIDGDI